MRHRRWLGVYAGVFAAAGAVFVALPGVVTALLSVPGAGRSLWLGLTGSLMAVLTLLAWELSRDPAQAPVWRALLLSKAVSSDRKSVV